MAWMEHGVKDAMGIPLDLSLLEARYQRLYAAAAEACEP